MEVPLVESYQFKQLKVTRTIGKMNETFNMQWIEESDIVKRRGNFQGQFVDFSYRLVFLLWFLQLQSTYNLHRLFKPKYEM